MQIDELMHYNIQSMVLGLKKILSFSYEYKYKYIWVDKKRQIAI